MNQLLILLSGLFLVLQAPLAAVASPGSRATVLSIGDGDTIRVLQGQQRITIRLGCIDAPEMAQSPYGNQSRAYLQTRLRIGAPVTLLPQTVDRYGRTVAEVIGEINVGLAMVEDGQAFAYRKYLGQCDSREYLEAEFRASRRRYGVWQVPGGITRPWDFRRGRTARRSATAAGSIPGGRMVRCGEIGSFTRAQELLRQGHTDLDWNGDGKACGSLQ
ncbi:thermonuclease family protein [Synechococcus sp. Tobar12-5m-g]|uniref:thermonuclease family protein n=1 Tax=Synechococcus sp. Tobar12-5m-g TaxID=2823742 RepID=UPI0020CB8C11|nr:thermonuclease family protein [Synechococcus sp. Tobar12-5m-g]MCP9773883.1 thermonuclease family protein [Synechococcus sp. Tobar12-5m-g]